MMRKRRDSKREALMGVLGEKRVFNRRLVCTWFARLHLIYPLLRVARSLSHEYRLDVAYYLQLSPAISCSVHPDPNQVHITFKLIHILIHLHSLIHLDSPAFLLQSFHHAFIDNTFSPRFYSVHHPLWHVSLRHIRLLPSHSHTIHNLPSQPPKSAVKSPQDTVLTGLLAGKSPEHRLAVQGHGRLLEFARRSTCSAGEVDQRPAKYSILSPTQRRGFLTALIKTMCHPLVTLCLT